MSELRTPRGSEWDDVALALRYLTNELAARVQYPEGHPAITRADAVAADSFQRLLAAVPELVVALKEDEFIVCDRPMPELRSRLGGLASAMAGHAVECLVFQRGLGQGECATLARLLSLPGGAGSRVREAAPTQLQHVLLRFAELRSHERARAEGLQAESFQRQVQDVLDHVAGTFAREELADLTAVRTVARRMVEACATRAYKLELRSCPAGEADQAAHAASVSLVVAALALEGQLPHELCVEVTSAALLHDVGHLLLPAAVRDTPEPSRDEQQRRIARNHCFAGALALLSAGCPPLWVSAALEHHRGIDGRGYPALEKATPPHELVRLIALASFVDRKRTLVDGLIAEPEAVLRQAQTLEPVYFGPRMVARYLRALGVYPPGTLVELSSRELGQVTQSSLHSPLRPMVQLLTGPDAELQVDLKDVNGTEGVHTLSITRAVLAPLALRPGAVAMALPVEAAAEDDDPDAAFAAAAAAAEAEAAAALALPPAPVPVPVPAPAPGPAPAPAPAPARTTIPGLTPALSMPHISAGPRRNWATEVTSSNMPAPKRPSLTRQPAPSPTAPSSSAGEADAYLARLGGPRMIPMLARASLTGLSLDHRAGFLLTFIDGTSSLDDLLDITGLPRLDVLRIVDQLVQAGVVRLG